jgi:hypothetical protein
MKNRPETGGLAGRVHLLCMERSARAKWCRNFADALFGGCWFDSPWILPPAWNKIRCPNELRPLFDKLADRKPPIRQYYRTTYLTDGKRLIWEYPRDAGKGEQMDFA